MKKTTTFSMMMFSLGFFLFMSTGVSAQFTVTFDGGGPIEKITFNDALDTIKKNPAVSAATITVAAGEHSHAKTHNAAFGRPVVITVQGAGAANTWLMRFTDEAWPSITGGAGLIHANDNSRIGELQRGLDDGLELIFKDISFRNIGAPPTITTSISVVYARRPQNNVKVSFINCNFRNLSSSAGAVVRLAESPGNESYFENCSFTNITPRTTTGVPRGALHFSGGKHTIKNCTFYNNSKILTTALNTITDTAGSLIHIIDLSNNNPAGNEIILENNIFIDTRTVDAPVDILYPVMSIVSSGVGTTNTITMNDNIFIGNRRAGKENDCDIFWAESDQIVFSSTNSGNIANKAIKRVYDPDLFGYKTVSTDIPGFKILEDYTYTHTNINFTMEGDLPKVFVDDKGVDYVVYTGDGGPVSINKAESEKELGAFPNPSNGLFEIVISENQINSNYEVYDAIGKIVRTGKFESMWHNLDMRGVAKGLYFLKLNSETNNTFIRLMVK